MESALGAVTATLEKERTRLAEREVALQEAEEEEATMSKRVAEQNGWAWQPLDTPSGWTRKWHSDALECLRFQTEALRADEQKLASLRAKLNVERAHLQFELKQLDESDRNIRHRRQHAASEFNDVAVVRKIRDDVYATLTDVDVVRRYAARARAALRDAMAARNRLPQSADPQERNDRSNKLTIAYDDLLHVDDHAQRRIGYLDDALDKLRVEEDEIRRTAHYNTSSNVQRDVWERLQQISEDRQKYNAEREEMQAVQRGRARLL